MSIYRHPAFLISLFGLHSLHSSSSALHNTANLQLFTALTQRPFDMHNNVHEHNPRAQQRAEARACSIVEVRREHSSGILAVFLLFYAYLIELR